MAFDKPTRNRLASFVSHARTLIADEFTEQFQQLYGISERGATTPLDQLGHLDDAGLAIAALLRERIEYLVRSHPEEKDGVEAAVARLAREQAFTVLNRLAAIRMAEKRGFIVESVGKGYQSKGFKVFEQVAGSGLGDTYQRYRRYLYCLFDELAVDLGLLFDRHSPQGLLFPREPALQELLALLNATDLDILWAEDETIGWIYQYWNDPAERKKMRDESAAPRNSRELAVRNQFFTPRYVVEFLTDNTLGRIWYEMTQGQTRLKDQCRYLVRRPNEFFLQPGETAPEQSQQDNLSQEQLLQQPVHIQHRPLKDPREIRMLDPACGSMHFGLYAFDLFEVIYDEAWETARGSDQARKSFASFAPFVSFVVQYPDKAAFLADVPRLIIEHNLHGIDIDPRAAQIAGLSLWLRAQRTWQQQGLRPQNRPRIRRSNIVCAEPMPGDETFLDEFIEAHLSATPERKLLGQLLRRVFDAMKLAGEAGSLLKIEEEISNAVKEAQEAWNKLAAKPRELFGAAELNRTLRPGTQQDLVGLDAAVLELATDHRPLTTDFWEKAEERIYAALQAYAEQAERGATYQRRLFADDAARGFAFIDLFRKRYDVVVMNPPFGNPSVSSRVYLSAEYPKLWADVYAAFVERAVHLLCSSGRLGAITSRTFLALSSFESLRDVLLETAPIQLVAECGLGVLDDATVRAAIFVAARSSEDGSRVLFWDLRRASDRGIVLHSAIMGASRGITYSLSRQMLRTLPGKPFAYWLPERFLRLLSEGPPIDAARVTSARSDSQAEVAVGVSTTDDPRFVRCHWEVAPTNIGPTQWTRFAHAAGFCRFHAPSYTVLNWNSDGKQLLAVVDNAGNIKPRLRCQQHFFQRGLVSPYISERGLGCSYLPEEHIVSNSCRAFFKIVGSSNALVAYLNSSFIDLLLWALTPDRKHEAGIIASLPALEDLDHHADLLGKLGRECWQRMFYLRTLDECDPYHCLSFQGVASKLQVAASELKTLQDLIDDTVARAVGEDASRIKEVSEIAGAPHDLGEWLQSSDGDDLDDSRSGTVPLDILLAKTQLSHALGTAVGRWDIRFGTGEKPAPELPDPFAPLPACPPGQLQNEQGLPITKDEVGRLKEAGRWNYPIEIPWDGILVDDPGHSLDLETRVHQVLQVIWKDRWDAIDREACDVLGVRTLRDYFRKPAGFFADHLKRYSKSRRQAPIYWPLSTAKGSYTLWIYYHRLTDQTLHTALADFVDPKLKAVRAEISSVREAAANRTRLEELLDLEKELEEYRAEIERIIKLTWKPNLNDGVLITASPLWKLFRLPKWQKELKACWDNLAGGEYDWAYLAYSIWPKRVEAACKTDRSIAIAHGMEHLCQMEPPKAKAKRGKKRTTDAPEELAL